MGVNETNRLIGAMKKLLRKAEESLQNQTNYLTDEEQELLNYLSAFWDGFQAGKRISQIQEIDR